MEGNKHGMCILTRMFGAKYLIYCCSSSPSVGKESKLGYLHYSLSFVTIDLSCKGFNM